MALGRRRPLIRAAVAVLVALVVAWVALVAVLVARRPDRATLAAAARLLPDTVRLVRRLATDPEVPRGARASLWLLLAYLALPLDLVPDVIPVVGLADDVILVAIVLRRLVRRAGPERLAVHWPGAPEGFDALRRVLRLG